VLTLLTPLIFTLLSGFIGITLNLAFPWFDWINPLQPVKQGMSVMLTLFGCMALVIVLALVYAFLLSSAISLEIYMLLCTVVFFAASLGLYAYITGAGSRKFDRL
jgi:ABC-2 type transport system permease protein